MTKCIGMLLTVNNVDVCHLLYLSHDFHKNSVALKPTKVNLPSRISFSITLRNVILETSMFIFVNIVMYSFLYISNIFSLLVEIAVFILLESCCNTLLKGIF